ncbi:MAG: FKBP-type peptidyl-prolyl cis-trans isomerase [Gemmatimonadota bacterium]|nr:FKBP-type peptidyl-prolyl cis-trans isomerase [Gemmatimonadota bacterium]
MKRRRAKRRDRARRGFLFPPREIRAGFLRGLPALVLAACAGGAAGEARTEEPAPDADGVITTRSGLKYKILAQGAGPKPTARDRVLVHYFCALSDGTVVDSSYERGQPDVLALRDLIRGFRETLRLMSVGSHFRVAVPAHLGYGREGVEGLVPPNEPLIFEIELHKILER